MAFPPAFLDELAARNPIEEVVGQYVSLTRKGSNLFGLCPFHSEKSASFSVSPDKGLYYCFGCHKGGDVISFIKEQESLDYPDAVRFLARRANMTIPEDGPQESTYRKKEHLWQLCRDAGRFYYTCLRDDIIGAPGRSYLDARGVPPETRIRFGLGYAPDSWNALSEAMLKKGYEKQDLLDAGLANINREKGMLYDRFRNRVMFPIIDVRGNVIGFGGRVLGDGTPKYYNSPETLIFNKRKNLFALNLAKSSKEKRLILTEGYMDAMSLHQYGFDCAVASLGTSLTEEHVNIISKYTKELVLIYDSDAAGQNATQRAISMLEQSGVSVRILKLPGSKDPDEFLKKYGAERFRQLLDQTENPVEYRLHVIASAFDLTAAAQKSEFGKQVAQYLATRASAIERDLYGAQAAEMAGISPEAMKAEIARAYKKRQQTEKKQQENQNLAPVRNLQPKIRGLRYDNIRSARAEEGLLRLLLLEPALLDRVADLDASQFSVELFGRVYSALQSQHRTGVSPSLATLGEEFSAEELSHLAAVLTKEEDSVVSHDSLDDYCAVIVEESALNSSKKDRDLMKLWDQMKRAKGGSF